LVCLSHSVLKLLLSDLGNGTTAGADGQLSADVGRRKKGAWQGCPGISLVCGRFPLNGEVSTARVDCINEVCPLPANGLSCVVKKVGLINKRQRDSLFQIYGARSGNGTSNLNNEVIERTFSRKGVVDRKREFVTSNRLAGEATDDNIWRDA
jgi:hypothetical protein